MKLSMFIKLVEGFLHKSLYTDKCLKAVISQPRKARELRAQTDEFLIFLRPKNTEGVIAVIYHHFYASRVK